MLITDSKEAKIGKTISNEFMKMILSPGSLSESNLSCMICRIQVIQIQFMQFSKQRILRRDTIQDWQEYLNPRMEEVIGVF